MSLSGSESKYGSVVKRLIFSSDHLYGIYGIFQLRRDRARQQYNFHCNNGYHLILVTDKTDSKIPDFEEIKAGLTEHFRQSKITYEMGRVCEELRKNFDVKIDEEILERKRKDFIAAEKDA